MPYNPVLVIADFIHLGEQCLHSFPKFPHQCYSHMQIFLFLSMQLDFGISKSWMFVNRC